ncbi:hypothetical protein [Uliginosibacterium sp. 31-12]|uniref:hypothetical protein n=1 Tax=Uliginosibacterium sp. 31-12 TaxID=3062781 RepID=UPI0026E39C09|nr:hypothetical protein [Uliginosibacterium sp. 31-12]MDO6386301.1 hypothetical protein [Uliginosibacterium sp. 31-12]
MQLDSTAHIGIAPISALSAEGVQHPHGYIGALMAASEMAWAGMAWGTLSWGSHRRAAILADGEAFARQFAVGVAADAEHDMRAAYELAAFAHFRLD